MLLRALPRRWQMLWNRTTQGADSLDDEVGLMHAPIAVIWHVSKHALAKHQQLSRASDTNNMMTKNGYMMTCLGDFDLAHAQHKSNTFLP